MSSDEEDDGMVDSNDGNREDVPVDDKVRWFNISLIFTTQNILYDI